MNSKTTTSNNATVTVYTDGACKGNPGIGGWGAYLKYGEHEKFLKGGEKFTTNNRMELNAVIEALRALKFACTINLYTDSKYVQKGVSEWLVGWKKNGWRKADKSPLLNVDLWQALDKEIQQHTIQWHWVKGHSGDVGNEIADRLANEGASSVV